VPETEHLCRSVPLFLETKANFVFFGVEKKEKLGFG
jgi:hypothetical protein